MSYASIVACGTVVSDIYTFILQGITVTLSDLQISNTENYKIERHCTDMFNKLLTLSPFTPLRPRLPGAPGGP